MNVYSTYVQRNETEQFVFLLSKLSLFRNATIHSSMGSRMTHDTGITHR